MPQDTPLLLRSPPKLNRITLHFHGSLNPFLPVERRKKFVFFVKGRPSVKDTIEALGVPHPEVGCIFVQDRAVDFSYQICSGDAIQVYPVGYAVRRANRKPLRPPLPRTRKFVLDSHLGKLVRHLRLSGFDCAYKKIFPDREIVETAVRQKRIILTRDIGLLKNGKVVHGYWVRSTQPEKQLIEVDQRYHLFHEAEPFTRCLECNGRIRTVAKAKIQAGLPEQVRRHYRRFYQCRACRKIYWKGSHYAQLSRIIRRVQAKGKARTTIS